MLPFCILTTRIISVALKCLSSAELLTGEVKFFERISVDLISAACGNFTAGLIFIYFLTC